MANRYQVPLSFHYEKNVTYVYGRVVFGASGAVTLDQINSKGIAAINPMSVSFTGSTLVGAATVGIVSSFNRLFTGMTVTGSGTSISAATTIGSMSATLDSLTISSNSGQTIASNSLVASGGQFGIQFGVSTTGSQSNTRLDAYNKLLHFNYSWDESLS